MSNMWTVRAGKNAFLIDDFKELNIVTIGWEVGDLSDKSSSEIKEIMTKNYPDANKKSLGLNSSQVINFVCEFQLGDWVISYNPHTRKYLVGNITSDYYYSDKLAKRYNKPNEFYCHFRDVNWIGEVNRDDLNKTASEPLKANMTIINLNDSAKNNILYSMNNDKIEWTDFYMEFADKVLEYKDNRAELINKIQNVFNDLNMTLPTLERDSEGNVIVPFDIDPFTVFALFNKNISAETRINILKQIKKEFLLKNDVPYTFHGIAVVNNLKATFYWFNDGRGKNDIDNLWNLYQSALNYSKKEFIKHYDIVLKQKGIKYNHTMGLNWIRPFDFIGLDQNNREILSHDDIFSDEFKEKINSLKTPPKGEQYLKICEEVKSSLNNSKYNSFPELSHNAYISKHNDSNNPEGIGDEDVKSTHYWLISPGQSAYLWDEFYNNGEMGIGFNGTGDLSQYDSKEELKLKFQEMYDDTSSHKNNVHACWQFVHDIQIGDVIFAKNGMSEIIGRGIVEGDYEYDTTRPYHKIRKVKWTHNGHWEPKNNLPMKTLTDITIYTELVNGIKELFVSEEDGEEEIPEIEYPEYGPEKFLKEVYISENDYNIIT